MQVITYQVGKYIVQQLTEQKSEEHTLHRKVFILNENQSTYIPLGEVHRLANLGGTPL